MTTTQVPTDNSDAVQAMRRLLTDTPIIEHVADMLVFGAQHGMLDPATVPLDDWDSLHRFLDQTGLERAWDEDQERLGVSIVCPSWCTIKHAAAPGGSSVVTPWEGVVGHETTLAAGQHVSVDLVQEQVHPGSGREAREFVTIWTTGDGDIELPPADLAGAVVDFGSTLQRAQERLAEIQAAARVQQ